MTHRKCYKDVLDWRKSTADALDNMAGSCSGYSLCCPYYFTAQLSPATKCRPHTHTAAGELKATALQTAAASKYRKHHAGYRALGIGFVPFIVDSLGRLHDDAQRILWHLAGRQIARNYQRRGWQAGGRHLRDYQRDHARRARFLALECAMYGAVAGVRQRMPPSISTGIPADGGRHLHPRGATTTCNRQWAFHDPEIGTGFDLGGG